MHTGHGSLCCISPCFTLLLGGEYVTDEMLSQVKAVMVLLYTCEGVDIKIIFFFFNYLLLLYIIGSAEALPILCVRCAR